jgi:rhodanese-related sulfurtransferase
MLDLREKSDYDSYHIKEALSFPAPNISRDKFLVEMINLVLFI